MKTSFLTLAAMLIGATASLQAQTTVPATGGINGPATVRVTIDDGKAIMQTTPSFQVNGPVEKKTPHPRKWLEIEVTFKADKAPAEVAKSGPTIDDMEFKYYIVTSVTDPVTKKPIMLTGTVSHVNVTTQDKTHSVMYASPAALEKLTRKSDFNDNDVKAYAIEITSGGQSVAEFARPAGTAAKKWWRENSGIDGILVDKTATPFAPLWSDYHADVKPK